MARRTVRVRKVKDNIFCFIEQLCRGKTGELQTIVTPTFAISTSPANELCARIHNSKKRMPTILPEELAKEWMQDGLSKQRITEIAAYQYPNQKMEAYSVRKDFQEIVDPKTKQLYPELEAEFC